MRQTERQAEAAPPPPLIFLIFFFLNHISVCYMQEGHKCEAVVPRRLRGRDCSSTTHPGPYSMTNARDKFTSREHSFGINTNIHRKKGTTKPITDSPQTWRPWWFSHRNWRSRPHWAGTARSLGSSAILWDSQHPVGSWCSARRENLNVDMRILQSGPYYEYRCPSLFTITIYSVCVCPCVCVSVCVDTRRVISLEK